LIYLRGLKGSKRPTCIQFLRLPPESSNQPSFRTAFNTLARIRGVTTLNSANFGLQNTAEFDTLDLAKRDNSQLCPGGGIGRRTGLKIPRGSPLVPVRPRPRAPLFRQLAEIISQLFCCNFTFYPHFDPRKNSLLFLQIYRSELVNSYIH
jgi:hypothetical protein